MMHADREELNDSGNGLGVLLLRLNAGMLRLNN